MASRKVWSQLSRELAAFSGSGGVLDQRDQIDRVVGGSGQRATAVPRNAHCKVDLLRNEARVGNLLKQKYKELQNQRNGLKYSSITDTTSQLSNAFLAAFSTELGRNGRGTLTPTPTPTPTLTLTFNPDPAHQYAP